MAHKETQYIKQTLILLDLPPLHQLCKTEEIFAKNYIQRLCACLFFLNPSLKVFHSNALCVTWFRRDLVSCSKQKKRVGKEGRQTLRDGRRACKFLFFFSTEMFCFAHNFRMHGWDSDGQPRSVRSNIYFLKRPLEHKML